MCEFFFHIVLRGGEKKYTYHSTPPRLEHRSRRRASSAVPTSFLKTFSATARWPTFFGTGNLRRSLNPSLPVPAVKLSLSFFRNRTWSVRPGATKLGAIRTPNPGEKLRVFSKMFNTDVWHHRHMAKGQSVNNRYSILCTAKRLKYRRLLQVRRNSSSTLIGHHSSRQLHTPLFHRATYMVGCNNNDVDCSLTNLVVLNLLETAESTGLRSLMAIRSNNQKGGKITNKQNEQTKRAWKRTKKRPFSALGSSSGTKSTEAASYIANPLSLPPRDSDPDNDTNVQSDAKCVKINARTVLYSMSCRGQSGK